MEWYLKVLKQYADFSGRARRKEYWMFVLFNIIFSIAAVTIDGFMGTYIFSPLYSLAVFVPSLAVTVRRLHDMGKCGWWMFIVFVPVIGWIWLFVLLATDSEPAVNEYGPSPKY